MGTFAQRVREVVGRIPSGRLLTYGRVAVLAGGPPLAGPAVASALGKPGSTEGWHRVVAADGRPGLAGADAMRQRECLEEEGMTFDEKGRVVGFRDLLWGDGPAIVRNGPIGNPQARRLER